MRRERLPTRPAVRAAPFALLETWRKTECGASWFLTRLAVRAAPFAVFAVLVSAVWAQDLNDNGAGDISVTLRVQNGRTQFRLGEIIPVALTFQSIIPSRYLVWTVPAREFTEGEFDRFQIEPAEGTVTFSPRRLTYNGPGHQPDPLGITPIKTALTVNDWIAIRKPGHYRLTVETKRALHWLSGGRRGMPVTLR
jgi:hypothetical protein